MKETRWFAEISAIALLLMGSPLASAQNVQSGQGLEAKPGASGFTKRTDASQDGRKVRKDLTKRFAEKRDGIIDMATFDPCRALKQTAAQKKLSTTLHGCLLYSSNWGFASEYGVYSINTGDWSYDKLVEIDEFADGNGGGTYAKGKFYASVLEDFYGMIYSLKTVAVDLKTGEKSVFDQGTDSYALHAVNMTYDPINDIIYSINYGVTTDAYTLNVFDPENNAYTHIGDLEKRLTAFCVDAEGQMYAIDEMGDVFALDKETAQLGEKIAETGFSPGAYNQSCCWSPLDGRIYWAACSASQSELIAIDPTEKTVETAHVFDDGAQWIGLYTLDPFANPAAPAAATNVNLKYQTPTSGVAELSFTLPEKNIQGGTLTGKLSVSVSVDGEEELSTGYSQTPGEQFARVMSLESGKHAITIVCANSDGEGLKAEFMTFTGEDRPDKPLDLLAEADDNGAVTLTWNAPKKGTNGGYINTADITYTVARNGEVLREDLQETSFADQLPADPLTSYSYSVTLNYRGEACGQAVSEAIRFGQAVALPYAQAFDEVSAFDLLTIINANDDDVTWQFEEKDGGHAVYNFHASNAADDYLVLPKMRLKANYVYKLSFDTYSGSSYNPERLEVLFGNEPEADALAVVLMPNTEITENANEPRHVELTYIPEADVLGNFALHCVSEADRFYLVVDNVKVEEIGSLGSPKAASDLTVVPDANGRQRATITFKAPTENYEGNQLGTLSKIELHRNGTLIRTFEEVTPGTALSHEDEAGEFGFNTYSVVAYDGEFVGDKVEKSVFLGIYTLPYEVTPDKLEFSLFTIVDNNADETTWFFDESDNSLKYAYNPKNDADDYAITPAIELGTANMIEVTFDAKAGEYSSYEEMEVTFGRNPAVADQQTAQEIRLTNKEYQTYKVLFEVSEAGRYYVGFRATSPANTFTMNVRSIKVENGSLMKAPAAAADASAVPAAQGKLSATLQFTLPTLSLEGQQLEGTVDVVVSRADGTVVSEQKNKTPGSVVSCTDDAAVQGDNNYVITTFNEFGRGGSVTVGCFCGIDVPTAVVNLYAAPTYSNLEAKLVWEAPTTGTHGGYFQASDITYTIYELVGSKLRKLGTTQDLTFTAAPSGYEQNIYTFAVSASTIAGEGEVAFDNLVLGNPQALPFEENAPNGITNNSPWISGTLSGRTKWGINGYIRSLGLEPADGGMFVCYDEAGAAGEARLQMPKLFLGGINAPTLTFSYYHYKGANSSLAVKVTTDDLNYEELFVQATDNETEGWSVYKLNLAEYTDEPWIAIVFDAAVSGFEQYVIIDGIKVANESAYDGEVIRLSGTRQPTAGEEATYVATVHNNGSQPIKYAVELYADGEKLHSIAEKEALESGATKDYALTFISKPEMIGKDVTVEVRVEPDGWTDEIPANNSGKATVTPKQPALPLVTDLAGEISETANELAWTQPSLAPETTTDSFEDYESFAYQNIGDYTLIDGDGLTPCGIFGVQFPNMGQPMAFQVWEPMAEGVDVDAKIWRPRTGYKCLVAWASLSSFETPYNDDYLISPEVVGGTELSFYATLAVTDYAPETFEVMYSTTTTDRTAFKKLATEVLHEAEWKQFKYELPAEARYFAIHYISSDKFALLVDDLAYVRKSSESNLEVLGYHVYRDGKKLTDEPVRDTRFAEERQTQTAAYQVTVVYDKGESGKSNTVELTPISIENNRAELPSVCGADGRVLVGNAEGLTVEVLSADGRLLRAERMTERNGEIVIGRGIYLVRIGESVVKVQVF